MASSIRLTNTGAPETPPAGYARIFVEEYNQKLYLKMKRPDGSIEVFGTINIPLDITNGGTGVTEIPQLGQFLIGTGTGYRLGDITAGPGINIVKTETSFEINTDISNIELQMPSEFIVNEQSNNGQNIFVVAKVEQAKNSIYAGPSDSNGLPTFRFLQVEDIPNLPVTKIIDLIDTIRAESLLIPVDSADIDHTYNSTTKTLSSILKSTSVEPGIYGSSVAIPAISIRQDGRINSATMLTIAIPHTQITDFTEATQDVVGSLAKNSVSINAEYDDYNNSLKFHVNEEHLITTNISESENQRAPTSQSVKVYVDDLISAERNARINEDIAINQKLNTFFNNAPAALDTIIEIAEKFDSVESVIESSVQSQTQTLQTEINRVYNAITAHREEISLTPQLINQSIPLSQVNQLSNIMQNSVVAFIDRIGIFEGYDFNLSNSNGQVVLNFTPEILNILDGTEKLRISYLTKI